MWNANTKTTAFYKKSTILEKIIKDHDFYTFVLGQHNKQTN